MEEFNKLLDTLLVGIAILALFSHIIFLALAIWRAWHGENSFDRLIGLDLSGMLIFCILIIFAILNQIYAPLMLNNQNNTIFVDMALGLAALSYLSTIALAKYIVDHRMF